MLCKSIDWFLYDRDLQHERVNTSSTSVIEGVARTYTKIQNMELLLREKCPYSEISGPYFFAFGLNTERYGEISLRIRSECGRTRTRKIPNTGIFYAVFGITVNGFPPYSHVSNCRGWVSFQFFRKFHQLLHFIMAAP